MDIKQMSKDYNSWLCCFHRGQAFYLWTLDEQWRSHLGQQQCCTASHGYDVQVGRHCQSHLGPHWECRQKPLECNAPPKGQWPGMPSNTDKIFLLLTVTTTSTDNMFKLCCLVCQRDIWINWWETLSVAACLSTVRQVMHSLVESWHMGDHVHACRATQQSWRSTWRRWTCCPTSASARTALLLRAPCGAPVCAAPARPQNLVPPVGLLSALSVLSVKRHVTKILPSSASLVLWFVPASAGAEWSPTLGWSKC